MSSNNGLLRAALAAALCTVALAGCASNSPAHTAHAPRPVAAARPVAVDLAELRVTADRGQSAELARRDRYECHNWAVEQSGETPRAAAVEDETNRERERDERNERVDRAIAGAAIGGVLGGIVRSGHRRNSNNGVLAGAAVGAAVGAATTSRDTREADSAPVQPSGYMRALTACLEGRGYTVALAEEGEAVARQR